MLNIIGIPSTRAHHVIAEHLAAVGIAAPADVTYAATVDNALHAAANPDPAADMRAAIAARMAPEKVAAGIGKSAAAIAAATGIEAARLGIQRDLDMLARQALHDNADQILEQLAELFDATAIAVATAVEMFGPGHPGSDLLSRPKIRQLWDDAGRAKVRLDAITEVRTDLADVNYGPPESAAWYVTTVADLDGPSKPAALIDAGIAVRLNTAAQSAELTAARDAAARERAERRQAQKDRDAVNNPLARAMRSWETDARNHGGDAA